MRTNWDRAEEGLRLCALMEEMTGVDDLRSQIVDALCQLMHTCCLMRDEEGEVIDFDALLRIARAHFEYEEENEPDQ